MRETVCRIVRRQGCHAVPAETGRKAIEIIRRQIIYASLVNYELPDTSGLEVLREIARRQPELAGVTHYRSQDIPGEPHYRQACILMSHNPSKQLRLEALTSGVFSIVSLPSREGVIAQAITDLFWTLYGIRLKAPG
jgi:CheY-like chemotaxis protein